MSSDVREVVRALDRECDLDEGYISVGVDLDIALRIVRGLKSLVEEIERTSGESCAGPRGGR